MKALLDKNGLDRRPHDIVPGRFWYYEEFSGLAIYNSLGKIGIISWRSIRASLKRHDAATKKRVKKPVGRSHRAVLRESGIFE